MIRIISAVERIELVILACDARRTIRESVLGYVGCRKFLSLCLSWICRVADENRRQQGWILSRPARRVAESFSIALESMMLDNLDIA
jgi:hypothetical protein